MFAKPSGTFTLNARDPVPSPPGLQAMNDLRPPPKLFTYYRDTKGYSPRKVKKMIEAKQKYEKECEDIEAQREVAKFEARMNPNKKNKYTLPNYPEPPKIDESIIKAFEPPEETKFFDYQIPKNPNHKKHIESVCTRCMSRGCPCCNPDTYNSIKPRTPQSTRIKRGPPPERVCKDLPYMIGASYWNTLDETAVPEKPKNVYVEHHKRPHFSYMSTGPRPAGIPIVVEDLITSRKIGQSRFEKEMSDLDDRAMMKRENTLRERAETSRLYHEKWHNQTRSVSAMSGQRSPSKMMEAPKSSRRQRMEEIAARQKAKEEAEEIARIMKYDDKLYEDYKKRKNPGDELERLMIQTGLKQPTQIFDI